jgi:hypothetical protein
MYNISRHERVRPLFQNCVVLRFICPVDDGNAVGVAASNGEDDLRRRKKVCRGISAAVNASAGGAPQVGWMTTRQERDKTNRVFFDTYLKMK